MSSTQLRKTRAAVVLCILLSHLAVVRSAGVSDGPRLHGGPERAIGAEPLHPEDEYHRR